METLKYQEVPSLVPKSHNFWEADLLVLTTYFFRGGGIASLCSRMTPYPHPTQDSTGKHNSLLSPARGWERGSFALLHKNGNGGPGIKGEVKKALGHGGKVEGPGEREKSLTILPIVWHGTSMYFGEHLQRKNSTKRHDSKEKRL